MRPKKIPGTLYVALGVDGEVLAQYTDREQANADMKRYGVPILHSTWKAFELAGKLGNVTYSRAFSIVPVCNEPSLLLCDEKAFYRVDGERFFPTLLYRLETYSKHWEDIQGIPDIMESLIRQESKLAEGYTSDGKDYTDMRMLLYMLKTFPRWQVHKLTPESSVLISNARVEDSKEGEEDFSSLDRPLFLCSSDPTRPMYGNVCEMAYLPYDKAEHKNGQMLLTTMLTPDMRMVLSFPIGEGNQPLGKEGELLIGDYKREQEQGLNANASSMYAIESMRFSKAFSVLLDCEKSPIEISDADRANKERLKRKGLIFTQRVTRYSISLSERYRSVIKDPAMPGEGDSSSSPASSYKEGKTLSVVHVSGFVREQAYGPGRTLRKKIWVDGFIRGQWLRNGVTYVTVKE